MIVTGSTEDTICSEKGCRRVFYTIALDDTHYVDIMISEESAVIYSMQNEDGTTVYDNNSSTYEDFDYDEQKAFDLAVAAFEKEYERRPDFMK